MSFLRKGGKINISSLLNIVGMTAAFAALYIILVQVHYDLNFNKGIKDSERIYLILVKDWFQQGSYMSYISRPIGELIVNDAAGVEAGGGSWLTGFNAKAYIDEVQMATRVAELSDGARKALGFEIKEGSWDDWNAENRPSVAVSESAARRFGLKVGDFFKIAIETGLSAIGLPEEVIVAAIYEDVQPNSDLGLFEMFRNLGSQGLDNPSEWSFCYVVKLLPGTDVDNFNDEASRTFIRAIGESVDDQTLEKYNIRTICLRDTYFNTSTSTGLTKGSPATTWSLLGIAILVVIIAFINYVNFFFAQIPVRLRDVNTRKIFGCSRSRLVLSLVMESVVLISVSLLLAAAVAAVFGNSGLANLIDASTSLTDNVGIALLTVVLGIIISVAASLYPALYITSFNTAFALKGTLGSVNKGKAFRTGLIGFQFTVSTILIICAIFIHEQRAFMLKKDMGFDKEQVFTVSVSWDAAAQHEGIESRLRTDAAIKDITWADGELISEKKMGWGRNFKGQEHNWFCYPVAWNFLQFMGIEVVEGRDFMPSDEQAESGVAIFNEAAKAEMDFRIGDKFLGHRDDNAEIIGTCKNFNYVGLQNAIQPLSLYIFGKHSWRPLAQLFIRTHAGVDVPAFVERVKDILHEFEPRVPRDDFDVKLIDSTLQSQYTHEQNLSTLVSLFTLLAIIISLMGVFGLVMFETEYRRKETGIRRVNGATIGEILTMFNSRFVRIVFVSFAAAVPPAWWVVNAYLMHYAYRIPIMWWVFAAALLAVLAITVVVVTMRSWNAATENPVKSLKNE